MRAAWDLQKSQLVALRRPGHALGAFKTEPAVPGDRAFKVRNADASVKEYGHDDRTG
jgi:hypothetical protein